MSFKNTEQINIPLFNHFQKEASSIAIKLGFEKTTSQVFTSISPSQYRFPLGPFPYTSFDIVLRQATWQRMA